jgi:FtsP/CotA-like multicopper oxidase with cupredoxin domain
MRHGHHAEHAPAAVADSTSIADLEAPDVRVELEAKPFEWRIGGERRPLAGWGYNGESPGPVIAGRVGELLSIRLTNSIAEPTTIHWHGLRIPSAMDGTDATQRPVLPGESFEYRFRLPDAGTFWYHPHANETVQLERGLYGALIVRGEEEPVVDRERILLLDDLRLTRRGEIAPPGGWLERHNGREGAVRLVNGRVDPTIEMAAGQTERWRIVNVANARYIRLSLGGREFRIIGSDGGLLEAPVAATEVLLTPADRIELLVGPFEEGARLSLDSLPYDRGTGRRKVERFASVVVGPAEPSVARVPDRLRHIEPLAHPSAIVTRQVRLSGRTSLRRGVDFMIDGEMHHRADPVRVGELQVWDIVNETPIDHPFHLHGFFFQVLSVNGSGPPYRSWEDTVNVPPKGTVRIAWLPDDRPGEWMYHCHILEHHAAGMMAHFQVVR